MKLFSYMLADIAIGKLRMVIMFVGLGSYRLSPCLELAQKALFSTWWQQGIFLLHGENGSLGQLNYVFCDRFLLFLGLYVKFLGLSIFSATLVLGFWLPLTQLSKLVIW